MNSFKLFLKFLLIVLITLLIISCEKKDTKTVLQAKKITVVTTLFPLYDFTRQIVKDKANVILLLPPGIEPHSFNPKPTDIATLHNADIFIYTNIYMEPWVGDILKSISNSNLLPIDSSKGIKFLSEQVRHDHPMKHRHDAVDPHIWLDISNAMIMLDNILQGIVEKDSQSGDFYRNNAQQYKSKMAELDDKFQKTIATCKKNIFASGGHLSFSYFAKRYNLQYLSVYESLSPDAEPTPKQLAKVIKTIKRNNLQHIFYEELITPKIAQIISQETGANLLMLHAAHNISKDEFQSGVTFISLMERNLENLRIALQCQ